MVVGNLYEGKATFRLAALATNPVALYPTRRSCVACCYTMSVSYAHDRQRLHSQVCNPFRFIEWSCNGVLLDNEDHEAGNASQGNVAGFPRINFSLPYLNARKSIKLKCIYTYTYYLRYIYVLCIKRFQIWNSTRLDVSRLPSFSEA